MKVKITITTPSGKVLEGFPIVGNIKHIFNIDSVTTEVWNGETKKWIKLHPGDKITIEMI